MFENLKTIWKSSSNIRDDKDLSFRNRMQKTGAL